jgi:hypothetical protein
MVNLVRRLLIGAANGRWRWPSRNKNLVGDKCCRARGRKKSKGWSRSRRLVAVHRSWEATWEWRKVWVPAD